ncbi:AraC family transcriptional regulator [Roseicyclus persicicus]|uniref:Helix-turn-helix transcriptional regulator n=1 Tax=Roseicyclus persicicus TaxID=2650661 RepID=A0A7X6H087_9RHOB|nr:AraC family transcriptional regulator [Roseibacterium persicicum]NKX44407.1 helix-turn-helix transcriptional regulator [Roseibacterium persicicum]
MLPEIDLALRGGAAALLLLLAVLMGRAPIGRDARWSVLAVAVTKSAFLAASAPLLAGGPAALMLAVGAVAGLVPLAVTWLLLTIFLDPPTPRAPWVAASAVVSALLVGSLAGLVSPTVCGAAGALLYAGLLGLALDSARGDLVEDRCRARPGFAMAIAGYGLGITGLQALGVATHAAGWFALLTSTGTLALALAFAGWILRPVANRWPGPKPAEADTGTAPRATAAEPGAEPGAGADPFEAALIARIEAAMEAGIWREEGLTIGALAARLKVPEHRLRRAINQGLGHRNFSSFINRARIAAAQAALSDPAQMGRTVLEIAYETGFASLGPFNRAFRAETGQSPTEYRRAALERAPADRRNPAPIPASLH